MQMENANFPSSKLSLRNFLCHFIPLGFPVEVLAVTPVPGVWLGSPSGWLVCFHPKALLRLTTGMPL